MSFRFDGRFGLGNHIFEAHASKDRVIAAIVCSLGGTVFGYDLGALSATSQTLRSAFSLGPSAFGLTISASLWGTVLGSVVAGYLAIYLGRRGLIASCALLYAIASATVAFAGTGHWGLLMALRFFSGVAIGGFTVGCPLYLAEIAPREWRGRFVASFQVQIGVGVVLGFTMGYLFAIIVPIAIYWRACFGFGAIPPLLLLLFLNQMPRKIIFGHCTDEHDRIAVLHSSDKDTPAATIPSSIKGYGKLFRRQNLRPLLLATSIALFNQLSGVNIILIYLLDVLSNTGAGFLQSHRYTLLIAGLGLCITVCGTLLVDKIGRKPLLISGAAGMAICLFALSAVFLLHISPIKCLVILVIYNACFAFSQGTIIWVYLSELFPFDVRAKGQSYGTSVHWIANAILISLFPTLEHVSPVWSFRFFAMMMLLQIVVALLWYPETKGIYIQDPGMRPGKLSVS